MNTLLIDGDILAYSESSAVERAVEWDKDVWTLHADAEEAFGRCVSNVEKWKEELGAISVNLMFTGDRNWRKQVFPEYKANRSGTRKPVCYLGLLEKLKQEYPWRCEERLEADDLMGIAMTSPGKIRETGIIVSADKDLLQIPGRVFNPMKPDLGVVEVSEEQADRWHLRQTLEGDRTDNYPGCPGVGPKTADKILDQDCSWGAVLDAFLTKGLSEDEALQNARVARILRHGEWNPDDDKVRLWTPEGAEVLG